MLLLETLTSAGNASGILSTTAPFSPGDPDLTATGMELLEEEEEDPAAADYQGCLLYTSPSPRD